MFPALIAALVPVQWAAKNAAHRAGVACSLWNVRPESRLLAVLPGVPSLEQLLRADSLERAGGTTSISEVVPYVVLCC
jgi:hypothetical protein